MAMKIPDSPNIIGADAVLRSPDMVTPVSEKFNSSINLDEVGRTVKNIGGLYASVIEEKEKSALNTLRASYTAHMNAFQTKTFQEHTGLDSANLYERYIQPESNKWLNNVFSAPKDDGQIRIANKDMQKEFSAWVISQQPTYISNSSIYGQREFDKHNKLVSEEIDREASNMLLGAASTASEATIKNALNMLYNNASDTAGGDPNLTKHIFASKADVALSAMIAQRAIDYPVDARMWLENPLIGNNISDASKAKMLDGIQKSYLNKAEEELALYKYSNGKDGSAGLATNKVVIGQIFGTNSNSEIESIMGDINNKAEEKSNAITKNVQGMHDEQITLAMNEILNAHNDEDYQQGLQTLYNVDPNAAIAWSNAKISSDSNAQDLKNLGGDAPYIMRGLTNELTNFGGIDFDRYTEMTGEPLSEEAKRIVLEKSGFDLKNVPDSTIEAAAENMVTQGRITPQQAASAIRIYKYNQNFKNNMDKYKELSTRIGSGEIQAYDVNTMGTLPPEMQVQLAEEIRVQNKLTQTKTQLKDAGIDLDGVVTKTGADAQYKNLDIASQNLFKNNLVTEINQYRATHGNQLPSAEAIEGMVYRVQRNSISPAMALTQQVLDEVNVSTDVQRYNQAINESIKPTYNTASKRTLSQQNERAESVIDKLAYNENINSAERNFILLNKDYLVRLLQNGATTQMANFLLLHNKWSY